MTTLQFELAESFDGDVSTWDVNSVTDMDLMFFGASSFDSDLSLWNTSACMTMEGMFWGARSFSSDISNWKTSRVQSMWSMVRTDGLKWVLIFCLTISSLLLSLGRAV